MYLIFNISSFSRCKIAISFCLYRAKHDTQSIAVCLIFAELRTDKSTQPRPRVAHAQPGWMKSARWPRQGHFSAIRWAQRRGLLALIYGAGRKENLVFSQTKDVGFMWAELRDLQVTEAKIWRTPRNRPIVQVIRTQINCLLR